jgi:hypothetical protein
MQSNEIVVDHTGDGTLVHGTSRDDKDVIQALKAAGFKWSRNLDAWYLPRTWGEATRDLRVKQLERALGDKITVQHGERTKSGTADDWVQARIERSEARAERLEARAERHSNEADAFHARSDAHVAGIPFGQPILVGHHSERRHRNALDKSWRDLGKAVEAGKQAQEDSRAAESARYNAENHDHPVRISRRLIRNEAELRKLDRALASERVQPMTLAVTEWVERITAMRTDLAATIERDKRVLTESGVPTFSKDTVKVGDIVTIRGRKHIVDKANRTTVQITSHGLTLKYPWGEVTAHTSTQDTETAQEIT